MDQLVNPRLPKTCHAKDPQEAFASGRGIQQLQQFIACTAKEKLLFTK